MDSIIQVEFKEDVKTIYVSKPNKRGRDHLQDAPNRSYYPK